jgi:hypothetical protein
MVVQWTGSDAVSEVTSHVEKMYSVVRKQAYNKVNEEECL